LHYAAVLEAVFPTLVDLVVGAASVVAVVLVELVPWVAAVVVVPHHTVKPQVRRG